MTPPRSPRRVLVVRCPGWPGAAGWPGIAGWPGARDQESASGARAFEQVVHAVEAFCPQVEVLRPGACAIGVRGPARYFGGEDELARKIAEAVRPCGFGCQVGVADGLFAAELAALAGPAGRIVAPGETPSFLAGHPVAVLGITDLADLLPLLGIRTLGDFAALPAAEAVSRFGTRGELAHRLARGLDPRPLVPRPPAADLSVRQEFDPPAGQAEPVVFAAKALADQMHDRLAASGLACVRLKVQVTCEDGRQISRLWRHDGLLSGLAVAERVRWQLDGWRTAPGGHGGPGPAGPGNGRPGRPDGRDADPGDGVQPGGITWLQLIPDQLVRAGGRQLGLWGDAVVSDRVVRAALRVQAMLGHPAVTRPVPAGGRSPAEQVLLVPFGDHDVPRLPPDRPWPGQIPGPAPATVFPVPLAATVTDRSGQAVTVTGRAQESAPPARLSADGQPAMAILSWAGPWPVTERWWDPARARRKARFQLVTEDGRAWLAVLQDGRWLAEASYD